MTDVLETRKADSPGYLHVTLSMPIGQAGAGVLVTGESKKHGSWELILHGQKELDIPADTSVVYWPDEEWKPKAK